MQESPENVRELRKNLTPKLKKGKCGSTEGLDTYALYKTQIDLVMVATTYRPGTPLQFLRFKKSGDMRQLNFET